MVDFYNFILNNKQQKGYIKVSLQMLGPNDEIVIHDIKSE